MFLWGKNNATFHWINEGIHSINAEISISVVILAAGKVRDTFIAHISLFICIYVCVYTHLCMYI